MNLAVEPLGECFACQLRGVDLRLDATPAVAGRVIEAMDRYAVAVLRGQHIDDLQQIGFSRLFGALAQAGDVTRLKHPELFDVSNLDAQGRILPDSDRRRIDRAAKLMWHTDAAVHDGLAGYSLTSARVLPHDGADTEFADLRAAHDELPDALRQRIERLPEALLVRTHPRTGRRSLHLAAGASQIAGLSLAEGRVLRQQLTDFATQPRFVYRHRWRVGDLLIWDNRCTVRRVTPFDDFFERRDLRRTTVIGEGARA